MIRASAQRPVRRRRVPQLATSRQLVRPRSVAVVALAHANRIHSSVASQRWVHSLQVPGSLHSELVMVSQQESVSELVLVE